MRRVPRRDIVMTTSHSTHTSATEGAAPDRRTTIALAVLFSLMMVGLLLTGGGEIDSDSSGEKVIKEFTESSATVEIGGFGLVITAALIVFWGVAIRARLTSVRRSWTADAVIGGSVAVGLTLAGWAVTLFALKDAVDSDVPEVAEAVNIMNNANFPPVMLGLACMMIGVGLTAWNEGSLPRWLAIVSIVLGAMAPLGPAGFAPFLLFPIWAIAISALIKTPQDS